VSSNEIVTIILIIVVPSALLWAGFYFRTRTPESKRARLSAIPRAMRPPPTDDFLETKRLDRVRIGGIVALFSVTIFIIAYWLPERQRQTAFAQQITAESIHRGSVIFQPPATLPPNATPQQFNKLEESISLGMGCANCHGAKGEGGQAPYTDPITGKNVVWNAPPLNNVFQRWDDTVVEFTIKQGRPGTPMPTWGTQYGGPMTDQMVADVMNWLHSLPTNNQAPTGIPNSCQKPSGKTMLTCGKKIFAARCAVCHGPQGQGKDMSGKSYNQRWFQGLALWHGKVHHLTKDQQYTTIVNGRRYAFMPPWGKAPSQGIPVPPFPLTNQQIQAVEKYERQGLPGAGGSGGGHSKTAKSKGKSA